MGKIFIGMQEVKAELSLVSLEIFPLTESIACRRHRLGGKKVQELCNHMQHCFWSVTLGLPNDGCALTGIVTWCAME